MSKRVVTTKEFMVKARKAMDDMDEMVAFFEGIRWWLDENLTEEQSKSLISHMEDVFNDKANQEEV